MELLYKAKNIRGVKLLWTSRRVTPFAQILGTHIYMMYHTLGLFSVQLQVNVTISKQSLQF